MVFAGLASGSSGNAWVFQHGASAILIDCGLSYKKLRQRFDSLGFNPYDVSACLLTHAHGDHHQAIRSFVKKHGPVIFCTSGCFQGIPWLSERPDLVSLLDVRGTVEIDGFTVKALPVIHDSEQAVTFSVAAGGYQVMTILETGRVTAEMITEARDADVILIEANHDPQMVADSINKNKDYWRRYGETPLSQQPPDVQGRYRGMIPENTGLSILSRHLSNESAARFLARAPLPKCRLAVLCHLSSDRNDPELALRTVRSALEEAGREMEVLVASQDAPTPLVGLADLKPFQVNHGGKDGDPAPFMGGSNQSVSEAAVGAAVSGDSDRW
jgi:phosphoribosyl 1,2-cyclic phosphodiesterase